MHAYKSVPSILAFICAMGQFSCVGSRPLESTPPVSSVEKADRAFVELPEPERKVRLAKAQQLHQQVLQLYNQGHFSQAVPLAREALALKEQALTPNHLNVAEDLNTLGLILHELVQVPEAQAAHRRALLIREQILGSVHPDVAESLTNLARVVITLGDYPQAQDLLERALHIRENALGPMHPDVAVTLMYFAMVRGLRMDLADALKHQARAVQIFDQAARPRSSEHAIALVSYGTILGRSGDFARARPVLERALQMQEQVLNPSHPHLARTLDSLADLLAKMGDWDDALPLAERARQIREDSYGPYHVEVAASLNSVGRIQWLKGNLSEAAKLFERALKIVEQSVGSAHPVVAANLLDLGEVRRQMGDYVAAQKMFDRAILIQERSLGPGHPDLAVSLARLSGLHSQRENYVAAIPLLTRAVDIREQALGPSHPDLALALNDLARLHHVRGDLSKARVLYERARQIYLTMNRLNQGLDDVALGKVSRRAVDGLYSYATLLGAVIRDPRSDSTPPTAVDDGFSVAEQARGWVVQAAVAKAIARQEVGSSSELTVVRQVEELRRRRQSSWTRLNELRGQSDEQRDSAELQQLRSQLEQLEQDLGNRIKELEAQSPRYAEIAMPTPLHISSVQQLLRPGEALISFYTLGDRVQIWLIRHEHTTVYREAAVGRAKLINLVQQIRESVLPKVNQASNESMPVPFDVEGAAGVYQLLFGSIESSLSGIDHLILVPDDVLLPLPFAALINQQSGDTFVHLAQLYRRKQTPLAKDLASYAALSWLAKSYPLTILPSASALRLIRKNVVARTSQGEPFLGFGDPVLLGKGNRRGGKMIATRGMRVAVDSLHALDRLPGTREEVLTVANVLHVNPETSVFLGHRATEAEVHRLNHSGRLGQARVILFATHGLLAGEVQGVTQPALVLTPPTVPTDDNDGLLSMEDVLQLKLPNTDWVILSACNTAGGDGSGESLSGLARAFFFAGAKGLLVSQWSVDDLATKELMTQIFRRYGANNSLAPAEALRQGMLALLETARSRPQQAYFAHPFAWASFMLVGEGQ